MKLTNQADVGGVKWNAIPTNPDCREYHFRIPIIGYCSWDRSRGFSIDPENKPPTVVLLGEIVGVTSIHKSNSYSLLISKGAAFDWDELHESIVNVLALHNAGEQQGKEL